MSSRTDLNEIMMGVKSFDDQIDTGKATLKSDKKLLDKLKTMLSTFSVEFELIPGTLSEMNKKPVRDKPFKQESIADSSGG